MRRGVVLIAIYISLTLLNFLNFYPYVLEWRKRLRKLINVCTSCGSRSAFYTKIGCRMALELSADEGGEFYENVRGRFGFSS